MKTQYLLTLPLCALFLVACDSNNASNTSPVLNSVGDQVVVEGQTLVVNLSATDRNGADVLSFSVTPTLGFAVLTDNGDGTATYELTPAIGDTSVSSVNIMVTDNAIASLSDAETITVTVPDATFTAVSGTVKDATTLAPIADAIVGVQTTPFRAVSASDGTFEIYLAPGNNQIVAGGKKGFFNSSVAANAASFDIEILLTEVPLGTNTGYAFVDSTDCGVCHPNQEAEWNNSAMALAGTNTWVHDIYAGDGTAGGLGGFVYTRDSVFAGTNPDSECASCHQPERWVSAGFSGRMEGPTDGTYPSAAVTHGISCDVCHKIADVDRDKINTPGIFPGAVTINLPDSGQIQYGAYPDSDFHAAGTMEPAYQPQLMAEVCGACHQDKNDPDENHSYNGIISEPTYTEWKESAFGDPNSIHFKTCVDCHMPATGATQACINVPYHRDPSAIRSHVIEGTTAAFLDNAVELTLQANDVGGELQVQVDILNSLTGHHVPTGVTIRNMILVVQAWEDGNDPLTDPLVNTSTQVIHGLGGVGNPAQGYYAGLPGKFFAKHNHDATGAGPTFFTDATGILFDTRIPALATDTTNYTFSMPATGTGTVHVRARLIYRRSFRFLTDAKGWTQDGHGNPLEDVAAPYYGHLMEEAVEDVVF
ncbi:MAG: hypothetical protein GY930_09420 [bacterium]|nr:hypothetical protein [bacterium]